MAQSTRNLFRSVPLDGSSGCCRPRPNVASRPECLHDPRSRLLCRKSGLHLRSPISSPGVPFFMAFLENANPWYVSEHPKCSIALTRGPEQLTGRLQGCKRRPGSSYRSSANKQRNKSAETPVLATRATSRRSMRITPPTTRPGTLEATNVKVSAVGNYSSPQPRLLLCRRNPRIKSGLWTIPS